MHFVIVAVSALLFASITYDSVDAWAVRGRVSSSSATCGSVSVNCQNYVPGEVSTAAETAFAPLGCPCALVGQKCGPASSQCIGPNGDRKGNVGNGTPKRGTCGCRLGWSMNCTTQQCIAPSSNPTTCTIKASASSVTVGPCVAAYGTISGITISAPGCTSPLSFILAAASSTDKTPYIDIDSYTFAVFANNLLPATSSITQTYYVSAVDYAGLVSNQINFSVTVSPANSASTPCTC
jgi:hypothetical protein